MAEECAEKNENVVPLPGYRVPQLNREPVGDVIQTLEMLLERAKDGILIAFAYATVENRNDSDNPASFLFGSGWEGAAYTKCTMVTALTELQFRVMQSLHEED